MGSTSTDQRARLETLLELARGARGWSRSRLARALGRDPTKLIPESGNPKMDYVVALADVLEWPVGDVIDAIRGAAQTGDAQRNGAGFRQLNDELMQKVREGEYHAVVELARRMFLVATTPDERAHALIREAAGWDGSGRYPQVADACRRGLAEPGVSRRLRLSLSATLANAQYTLWDLTPALGTAEVVARHYEENPPDELREWKRVAYARYVRGNVRRRLMSLEPESAQQLAEAAQDDLSWARGRYESLANELGETPLLGFAHTCAGGLIELDVALGARRPSAAVHEMLERLDETVDLDDESLTGDMIESFGWWCVFGSNIALRHLQGRELQQAMAVFTNKALEVAERLDHWALRERVFTMQFSLHEAIQNATGLELNYSVDEDERATISATMGRFPSFRPVGWKILESARLVPGR